jgi:hypothetical protein
MIKHTTCMVLSLLLFCISAAAQSTFTPQTINIGGGTNNDPSSYYRYEWSIGEASVIQTFSSATLIVTAGVLQPGTNTNTVNTSDQWGLNEIKVFPNPVVTQLEVNIISPQKGRITMLLYDASGRLMGTKELDYSGIGQITKWNFAGYSAGHYTLKVTLEASPGSVNKKGSFKIEKLTN